PTIGGVAPVTQAGTILGTFQYMAPEQLEGKEADVRSDVFAFGAVLYEMSTGRKAFSAASQASLITAIMSAEPPPISALVPATPPELDRIVRTCLAKDPEDRWQSAADLRRELRWIGESSAQGGAPRAGGPLRRNRERLAWAVAALAVVLGVAALAAAVRGRPVASGFVPPMRSSLLLGEKTSLRSISASPDGTRLVGVARDASGKNLLWIR